MEDIQLDDTAVLKDSELTDLKERLHTIVREEFAPTRAVKRLERVNQRAAIAQNIMDLMVIRSLLRSICSTDADNFWTVAKDIDERVSERERLAIPQMPVDLLRIISNDLIFEVQVPKVGEKTTATVPIILVGAAVDAGYRIADGMRVKKSELTVKMVQSRIEREIERLLKEHRTAGSEG